MAGTVSLMDQISAEQPITDMVNARMHRIEELERIRQEHAAARASAAGDNDTASSRLARRDELIRQTTRQQRSTERRSFASNIQRTPVRSMSYENTNMAVNASTEPETDLFREIFDNTRHNFLGGSRASGSTENLSSASFYGRRPSDTPLVVPRPAFQTGSDSGSGSSTPRTTSLRPQYDLSSGLAEAFASRASRVGSDTRLATREPRSMSGTRETRESTRSIVSSTEDTLTRAGSLQQGRLRDSRFRRRTIQGVDSRISQAIEQEKSSPASTRSTSPLVMLSTSGTSQEKVENRSVTQNRELTHSASFSSFSSRSDSSYKSYSKRIVELFPEDIIPVLGLENEKVIFIDNSGRCTWLSRHHQIVMSCRAKTPLPQIVMKPSNKSTQNSSNDCDGYVAKMDEDSDSRYVKLKQLIKCAKLKDTLPENGDMTDSSLNDLSLFEIHKRGDYLEKDDDIDADLDEKYKTVSLYTPPRNKPDIDSYFASKEVVPLYEGIPVDQLPPEIKAQIAPDEPVTEKSKEPVNAMDINQYEVARTTGIFESASFRDRYESGRRAAIQQQFYSEDNADGSSTSGYLRMDQSYMAESRQDGNRASRQYASESRAQQSRMLRNDSVGSILRQRAEARRQQFLSQSQDGNLTQRRAEERRQQHLSESQTSRHGNTLVQSSGESNLEQVRSETRSSDGHSQQFTSQRHETSSYRQTSTTEIQSPMVTESSKNDGDVDLVMERLFLMQGGDGPIDTSHLDMDEMKMIQKALEENPSPPPSPEPYDDNEYNESDFTTVQSETNPITNTQSFMVSSDRGLDSIAEYSEGPFGSRRSESETSASAGDSFVDNVILNESTSAETETNIVRTSSETVHNSKQTSLTSAPESANLVVVSRPSSLSSSSVSSMSNPNSFITARESVLTHTRSLDDGVVESRLPRYQRLPAADNNDTRLPLPTMDWSPLEKANSPISPKRFSFEEKKPEQSAASASQSNSSTTTRSTISKTSVTPVSVTRPSVHTALTIDIPDDNSKTGTPSIGRSNSNKSSSASPIVKSRNASRSGSEAPSPADSETVTTVFEEFVQTIPRELIDQWKNNCDD